MAKKTFESNPRFHELMDVLDQYREFCVEFGYPYNEATVFDPRVPASRQFNKLLQGKEPRNMWVEDAKAYEAQFQ